MRIGIMRFLGISEAAQAILQFICKEPHIIIAQVGQNTLQQLLLQRPDPGLLYSRSLIEQLITIWHTDSEW